MKRLMILGAFGALLMLARADAVSAASSLVAAALRAAVGNRRAVFPNPVV